MALQPLTASPFVAELTSDVMALLNEQEARQYALDPKLHAPRSLDQLHAALWRQEAGSEQALVVLDASGCVRGYARPSSWEIEADSVLNAFFTPCNGIALDLALPDPASPDASEVAIALLTGLSVCWQSRLTSGDLIRWPAHDPWIETVLLGQGFLLDSVCAIHPSQPFIPSLPMPLETVHMRQAQPEDEEALLELFAEELHYHELHVPFVSFSPQVLRAFRSKLARLWRDQALQDKAPLVIVAESQGKIVAMAENSWQDVSATDAPGFTPAGRYACLDHVVIGKEMRRRGIGHQLVQTVFKAFATIPHAGYILWYNPDNPQAARFWPAQGFHPLWTTYQRRHNWQPLPRRSISHSSR